MPGTQLQELSRRLRISVLWATLRLIAQMRHIVGRIPAMRKRRFIPRRPCNPGISIIIPERANPELLSDCLASVQVACQHVTEPVEVIIVVNGSQANLYEHLQKEPGPIQWMFFEEPLWFIGAIRQGLKKARYDWVYLLNNDMVLDPLALSELLKWRAPHIFSIASQIFFKDPLRRREETGWTGFSAHDGLLEIFDAVPEDEAVVRGTLYAGGGSSLFQKKVLRKLMSRGNPFYPFYWEDVEWGVMAWRNGFESLFCPTSKVWHSHRATHLGLFSADEIDRIFKRNGYKFQLRNPMPGVHDERLIEVLMQTDERSFQELMNWRSFLRIVGGRLCSLFYPFSESLLTHVRMKYFIRPPASMDGKPVLLLVSPFVIYPPSHGGAVRIHNLLKEMSSEFYCVVLSDEGNAYSEKSLRYFQDLGSIHLVSGRLEGESGLPPRIARIQSHSHATLKGHLEMLMASYLPDLIHIEYIELSKLVEIRKDSTPWLITLHDVLLPEGENDYSVEDEYEADLIKKYDAAVVCSMEDGDLLPLSTTRVVPNGVNFQPVEYKCSLPEPRLLFMGPFRYAPNLEGIQDFLKKVYPALRRKIPELQLQVLGGHDAIRIAAQMECFRQENVTVFDFIEDPRPFLDDCAVTINPLYEIRGSSIKLLESLAAGRVCVSTRDGARGILSSRFPSLIVVDRIEDFREHLELLLTDPSYRVSIERSSFSVLEEDRWRHSAERLMEL